MTSRQVEETSHVKYEPLLVKKEKETPDTTTVPRQLPIEIKPEPMECKQLLFIKNEPCDTSSVLNPLLTDMTLVTMQCKPVKEEPLDTTIVTKQLDPEVNQPHAECSASLHVKNEECGDVISSSGGHAVDDELADKVQITTAPSDHNKQQSEIKEYLPETNMPSKNIIIEETDVEAMIPVCQKHLLEELPKRSMSMSNVLFSALGIKKEGCSGKTPAKGGKEAHEMTLKHIHVESRPHPGSGEENTSRPRKTKKESNLKKQNRAASSHITACTAGTCKPGQYLISSGRDEGVKKCRPVEDDRLTDPSICSTVKPETKEIITPSSPDPQNVSENDPENLSFSSPKEAHRFTRPTMTSTQKPKECEITTLSSPNLRNMFCSSRKETRVLTLKERPAPSSSHTKMAPVWRLIPCDRERLPRTDTNPDTSEPFHAPSACSVPSPDHADGQKIEALSPNKHDHASEKIHKSSHHKTNEYDASTTTKKKKVPTATLR